MTGLEFLWLGLIVLEAGTHAYIIKVMKTGINHVLAGLLRVVVGVVFIVLFIHLDYLWHWSILYVGTSHVLIFPEVLNLFRSKRIGYLDSGEDEDAVEDSKYDRLIANNISELPWLAIRMIAALFSIAAFFYNITFKEMML